MKYDVEFFYRLEADQPFIEVASKTFKTDDFVSVSPIFESGGELNGEFGQIGAAAECVFHSSRQEGCWICLTTILVGVIPR